jgi:hypothetical protein
MYVYVRFARKFRLMRAVVRESSFSARIKHATYSGADATMVEHRKTDSSWSSRARIHLSTQMHGGMQAKTAPCVPLRNDLLQGVDENIQGLPALTLAGTRGSARLR